MNINAFVIECVVQTPLRLMCTVQINKIPGYVAWSRQMSSDVRKVGAVSERGQRAAAATPLRACQTQPTQPTWRTGVRN